MTTKAGSKVGATLLAVLALLMALGSALGGLYPVGQLVWRAIEVRNWQPVSAQVVESRINVVPGSDGAETYLLVARYRYTVQGREHVSSRLELADGGADDVDEWSQRWHARLDEARQKEQPVAAWFDPARPERSVLDRRVRRSLVLFHLGFALVFAGFASMAGYSAWRLWRGPAPRAGRKGEVAPQVRGRLDDDGGTVVFARVWPRFMAGGLMLPMLVLVGVAAGGSSVQSQVPVALAVTALLALAVHLATLRWHWRREGDELVIERGSVLHRKLWRLTSADLQTIDQVEVYTSSTNGGPTVHHPRLVAKRADGSQVELTPALASRQAAQAVQAHLKRSIGGPARKR